MKKIFKFIVVVSFIAQLPCGVYSQQEGFVISVRTPEQEALRQTERMKLDIDLSPTQEKFVYNINLKYERERQLSNKRSDALDRIRNKNDELKKVLTEQQYKQLQRKRYDQSSFRRERNSAGEENLPVE
jgi:hypothetical protein